VVIAVEFDLAVREEGEAVGVIVKVGDEGGVEPREGDPRREGEDAKAAKGEGEGEPARPGERAGEASREGEDPEIPIGTEVSLL
jgi:hypothetical protein